MKGKERMLILSQQRSFCQRYCFLEVTLTKSCVWLNWIPHWPQHSKWVQESRRGLYRVISLRSQRRVRTFITLWLCWGSLVLLYSKPGTCQGNLTLDLGIRWISTAGKMTNVDNTRSSYGKVNTCRVIFNVIFTPSNRQCREIRPLHNRLESHCNSDSALVTRI